MLAGDPVGTSLRVSHLFAQHFQEGRRAQQQLENGFKQLENVSVYGAAGSSGPEELGMCGCLRTEPLMLCGQGHLSLWGTQHTYYAYTFF